MHPRESDGKCWGTAAQPSYDDERGVILDEGHIKAVICANGWEEGFFNWRAERADVHEVDKPEEELIGNQMLDCLISPEVPSDGPTGNYVTNSEENICGR